MGLVTWVTVLIVTRSELFRPLRERVEPWHWPSYLLGCPLCTGVWIGAAGAAGVGPQVSSGLVGYVATALAFTAVGHLVLEAQAVLQKLSS